MGWSISDGPYRLVEADGQVAHTKRTLRPPGLNHLVGSIRLLSCAALKHGLALAVGFLGCLHGGAALKHGLALAIGSLVRLHDCAVLKHRLAIVVDSLVRSSALAQQRHDHFGTYQPRHRPASTTWTKRPAAPIYDLTNISYLQRLSSCFSSTLTIPATDTNHLAEDTTTTNFTYTLVNTTINCHLCYICYLSFVSFIVFWLSLLARLML